MLSNTISHHDKSVDGVISSPDVGLYLHIPFCAKRCHFCAFYLMIQEEGRIERFLRALEIEFVRYAKQLKYQGKGVSTVYVGGGTPTALFPTQLASVLTRVRELFALTDDCEVTVEATPESLTLEYLDRLLEAGMTRMSLGIQTFDQQERVGLGLSSTVEEARAGIQLLKNAKIANFNLDLIYGIPGQSLASWNDTLQSACESEPTHLSCYALSVEEGTRFDLAVRRGMLALPSTGVETQFQVYAAEQLEKAGYDQYEISNWSKPGKQCRHNRRYWRGMDYLGLGPSAQSYIGGCRFGNVSNLEEYDRLLEQDQLPIAERESLSIHQQNRERVVFGLRLLVGVPLEWIEFNKEDVAWASSIEALFKEHYLVQTAKHVALTQKGRQFADEIGYQLL